MKEAQITCLCRNIQLPDLDLTLTQGQVVYWDEKAARKSQDLARAHRSGGVSVVYVERFQERRPASPVVPMLPPFRPPKPVPQSVPEVAPSLDPDALARRIQDGIMRELRPLIQDAVKQDPPKKKSRG